MNDHGPMTRAQSTHAILKKHFEKRKSEDRAFSLRAVSQRLGVSPAHLSRVLSGQKPPSYALLLKLGRALDVDAETMTALRSAHSHHLDDATVVRRGPAEAAADRESWDLAEKETFSVLRQWFYLAILEFTTLKSFDGTAGSIARRLGVGPGAAEVALKELQSLGLLTEKNGRLRKAKKHLRWSTNSKFLPDVRRFHSQMLKKADETLTTRTADEDFARRLITGITITADTAKIQTAKEKLSAFLHELARELGDGEGTDVYHLSAQLFPLTTAEK